MLRSASQPPLLPILILPPPLQHHRVLLRAMCNEDLDGMWALFRAHIRMQPQARIGPWGGGGHVGAQLLLSLLPPPPPLPLLPQVGNPDFLLYEYMMDGACR